MSNTQQTIDDIKQCIAEGITISEQMFALVEEHKQQPPEIYAAKYLQDDVMLMNAYNDIQKQLKSLRQQLAVLTLISTIKK